VGGSFRAGWKFSEDPDKEGEFLMTNNKGNHAKDKSGLRVRPVGTLVRFPDGTEHEYPKIEGLAKLTSGRRTCRTRKKSTARRATKTERSPWQNPCC